MKKLSKFKSFAVACVLGLVACLGVAGTASAQTAAVDVSGVTSAISAASTAGATIGLAVLVMYFGLKLYKWVKQAG